METNGSVNQMLENEEAIRQKIGKGADWYLRQWGKAPAQGKQMGLNFFALIFGASWLAYRKMYKPACKIMIGIACIQLLFFLSIRYDLVFGINILGDLLILSPFLIAVYLFLFGNGMYFRHICRLVCESPVEMSSERKGKSVGGTSWLAAAIVLGITVFNCLLGAALILAAMVE